MPDTPVPAAEQRPAWACLLHSHPSDGRNWARADDSYRTCGGCYDRFRELLADIPKRYAKLDARPGANQDHGGRGAPGFGSRSPASDHIIAMRDPRSSRDAHTWLAGDGRLHLEAERPPLSVYSVLDTIAWTIAEERQVDGPAPNLPVHELCLFIDRHLDWLTRHELVVEVRNDLRELQAQLKPATGDPAPRHVGLCPNVIDEGEHSRECGARLYAPLRGDSIDCRACGRQWPREEWLKLGDLLEAS